ncbi:MAG: DNA repair ATPase [Acidobacteriota bacterium]|nr:DNA repair ATPase [Acidobacteriota bacterium]
MSDAVEEQKQDVQLEGGTYEIIRNRLNGQADELRARLKKLNETRKATFGSIETKLVGSERITTDNNCTPRDMVPIGDKFIFGYNVHVGLRAELDLDDVFAVYTIHDDGFRLESLDLIRDPKFEKDFHNLYKYYKKTVFSTFKVIGPHLFMKFRVGEAINDFKTFKWLIEGAGLTYMDNRSDHEFKYPPQHEFEWLRTRRDWFRMGAHPHISIDDRVFVETIGGDLTIKVEDNTDVGHGILDEPVENPDQTLDDAEIYYASIGPLILLKILPYQEKEWRYFVFNEKLQEAHRVDAIADSCVLLPDDHGIIFPKGYYLLTGELKEFDNQLSDMIFESRVPSPNGEDFLYVFYNRLDGVYILLSYNLIEQKVATPIICSGFSLFEDGKLIYFRADAQPAKHHALQIWQTGYVGLNYKQEDMAETALTKIGNKDVVRCMAECHEVLVLIGKEDVYANLYVDIVRKVTSIVDAYFWLSNEGAEKPREVLEQIRTTANGAIEEFEKVNRIKKATAAELARVSEKADALTAEVSRTHFEGIGEFVRLLAELRTLRGEIIGCRERRYIDLERVDELEQRAGEQADTLSQRCVEFLLQPEALEPYADRVAAQETAVGDLARVTAAKEVEDALDQAGSDLELLIEIVSNLKIDDATETTRIIDSISAIYADLNRVKSAVKNKKTELARVEGVAEFNAQMKLVSQGLINYLDVCDTPDKCETYLTKLTVQLEELEGKFAEFDEFIEQLTDKREEVYNAFEAKRLQLVEARNKKATSLFGSAERILKGVRGRIAKFTDVNEINGYFAGDLMVDKVRNIMASLVDLGETVKADDLQSRLKTIREEAVRQLKDKLDLYEDGGNLIKLGNHKFSVNAQTLALTTVLREDKQYFHLTGTNFFEEITDAELLATEPVWEMEVSSENRRVYRGEFLAYQMLRSLETGEEHTAAEALAMDDDALLTYVQRFMGPRFNEGYAKGVHDRDAASLLRVLLELHEKLGLLAYPPRTRACAMVFWERFCSAGPKANFLATCKGLRALTELFPENKQSVAFIAGLEQLIGRFLETSGLFESHRAHDAAVYLFRELIHGNGFAISQEAGVIYRELVAYLKHRNAQDSFRANLKTLEKDPIKAFNLCREWVAAYIDAEVNGEDDFEDEVAALLFTESYDPERVAEVTVNRDLTGFKGNHPLLEGGNYHLNYNAFMEKLAQFQRDVSPKYTCYLSLKKKLSEEFAVDLRLEEFKPRVLTSFVRNKLLDQVYLPIIGDNLAKQIGAAGAGTRTDRMGMLLLISPPGYGKTTLMEYIANRLGLIFMKINGPAIGHEATSIDPAAAPHSAAREELNKLNLSLEMGDNVMIYLDDIQHCNPELLQKFISLCDAQRKIEGVYKGRTRTYDLRGKKVCVVMAGNPYTESGDKFQIPDMLANRADTYNLGDIIGDQASSFELSYVENALTSNPVLNKLAGRSQKDVYSLIKITETGTREGIELEGNYTNEEVSEFSNVLAKLFRVRDVILRVNLEYIRSAAMEDAYRTEPAFKLQGSYRNMNKIAEKVLPIMNDAELETLIASHYENEAQTLTSGAEANLLKFRELCGTMTGEEQNRWTQIKRTFHKKQSMHGVDSEDKVGQVILQLANFGEGLEAIKDTLAKVAENREPIDEIQEEGPLETHTTLSPDTLTNLGGLLQPMMETMGKSLAQATAGQEANRALEQARAQIQALEAAKREAEAKKPEPAPAQPAAPKKPTPEIDPRFLMKVIRQQFNVMHHWLKPLYDTAVKNDKTVDDLNAAVNNLMTTHGSLLNYLQQFQGTRKPAPKQPPRRKKTET